MNISANRLEQLAWLACGADWCSAGGGEEAMKAAKRIAGALTLESRNEVKDQIRNANPNILDAVSNIRKDFTTRWEAHAKQDIDNNETKTIAKIEDQIAALVIAVWPFAEDIAYLAQTSSGFADLVAKEVIDSISLTPPPHAPLTPDDSALRHHLHREVYEMVLLMINVARDHRNTYTDHDASALLELTDDASPDPSLAPLIATLLPEHPGIGTTTLDHLARDTVQASIETLARADEEQQKKAYEKLCTDPPDVNGAIRQLHTHLKELENSPIEQSIIWHHIGALCLLINNDDAMEAWQQITKLDPEHTTAWNHIGRLHLNNGNMTTSKAIYEHALSLAEQQEDNALMAVSSGNLGLIARASGDLDRAEEWHQKSLALCKQMEREYGIASNLDNLAIIARMKNDIEQAKSYHLQSLKLSEKIHDTTGMANQLGNLGLIEHTQGNNDQAKEYLQLSLKLSKKTGATDIVAASFSALGTIETGAGNLDLAADYHLSSLKLEEQMGNPNGIAGELSRLGMIEKSRKNLPKAKEYFQRSIQANENTNNKGHMANTLGNLGMIHAQVGDRTAAIVSWRRAHALFLEAGFVPQAKKTEQLLQQVGYISNG